MICTVYPHLIWKPDPVLYACSNRSLEEWYARGEHHHVKGWIALTFGICAISMYILTLISISSKEFLQHSCYRMMYFTSLNDIMNLFVSNVASGYYLTVGANFCTHPVSNYIFGGLAVGGWNSMSVSVMALALGRFAELTGRETFLFRGIMTYVWIVPSVLVFIFCAFYTHPIVFNSKNGAFSITPGIIDDFKEEMKTFNNDCFIGISDFACIVITLTYICIPLYVISSKESSNSSSMRAMERNLLIQCSLIGIVLCCAAYVYTFVFLFDTPDCVKLLAQVLYQVSECGPLVGYLLFNHTIRRKFLDTIGLSRKSTSQINTIANRAQSELI